jgi:predicted dienelactone hydrolase
MRSLLLTLLLPALLILSSCGDDPVLAPAKPLNASPAALAQLYGIKPGPFEVSKIDGVSLPETETRRAITMNLYFPDQGEGFPLLLFSHGNWSNRNSYDQVINHWVSQGYVVIAPDHLDCCSMVSGILNSVRYGQYGLINERVKDFKVIMQALPEIAALAPRFDGKSDPSRIALTGHSFGAFTAQQFGGAAAFEPDSETYIDAFDERIKAIVALSPPGPMFDTITDESWLQLRSPTLVTTGTWDVQPAFWPDWRMHLMSHQQAHEGQQYALVVDGADHYLGNLICRLEREETPQGDALTMVNSVSTAFLDSYLKNKADAQAYLQSDTLTEQSGGFATLSRR